MQADFLDAHQRHWQDAELLMERRRLANADHLYGMAVECGLKRLMQVFGMKMNPRGPVEKADFKHAEVIWDRFETYRSGHAKGPGYALPDGAPFSDWKAEQRYAARNHFDDARVIGHRAGAEQVRRLIQKAEREGLLT